MTDKHSSKVIESGFVAVEKMLMADVYSCSRRISGLNRASVRWNRFSLQPITTRYLPLNPPSATSGSGTAMTYASLEAM